MCISILIHNVLKTPSSGIWFGGSIICYFLHARLEIWFFGSYSVSLDNLCVYCSTTTTWWIGKSNLTRARHCIINEFFFFFNFRSVYLMWLCCSILFSWSTYIYTTLAVATLPWMNMHVIYQFARLIHLHLCTYPLLSGNCINICIFESHALAFVTAKEHCNWFLLNVNY